MERLTALAKTLHILRGQVRDSEHIEQIMTALTDFSATIHAATREQVADTHAELQLIHTIDDKARQIVEKTSEQQQARTEGISKYPRSGSGCATTCAHVTGRAGGDRECRQFRGTSAESGQAISRLKIR